MSNLPEELVREILSRVPLTSLSALRCTCRTWNALSETQVFGNKAAKNQFLGFTVINNRVCSLRLDLQGILNEGYLVHQSTNKIGKFDQTSIDDVLHCDGLLLCVDKNNNLVVWNPYLRQTRSIPTRSDFRFDDDVFGFGYDNKNRNHKIIRVFLRRLDKFLSFTLYDFKSNSWSGHVDYERDFDLGVYQCGVSFKGNTYFVAQHNAGHVLVCFDFTTERFRPPMQFHKDAENLVLSCVREEKLPLLYKHEDTMDILITQDGVSWRQFLKVEITPLNGFPDEFYYDSETAGFFINEEKKVALVCGVYEDKSAKGTDYSEIAHVIGQDGYLKYVSILEDPERGFDLPLVFTSYVPSLVQLGINRWFKRKHKDSFIIRKEKKLLLTKKKEKRNY